MPEGSKPGKKRPSGTGTVPQAGKSAEEALAGKVGNPPQQPIELENFDALDAMAGYLNAILRNIRQGIIFISRHGVITTFNRAAEEILGISSQSTLFKLFKDVFSDDFFSFSIEKALKCKKAPKTTLVTYSPDLEHIRYLEVETSFISDPGPIEHHGLEGLILIIRDITEYRKLELAALRKNRMDELGEMISSIAHEIRNPLGGIKGFASLLRRDLEEKPEQKKITDYIIDGTEAIDTLIKKALHYTRPLKLHCEKCDVIEIIQLAVSELQSISQDHYKVAVTFQTSLSSLVLFLDKQTVKTALFNLATNALEATPQGGELQFRAEKEKGYAVIEVEDTGIGIAPDRLRKIFSPFFSTKTEGGGFGLSEVYKIVDAHGGTIDVHSTEDKGTRFTIKFPITAQSQENKEWQ